MKYTKSEFYKIWYSTRHENQSLQDNGYPNITAFGSLVDTEEKWEKFLENEIDLEEFIKLSEEACEILEVEYVTPHTRSRIYPQIGEQLDGIYKAILAIKNSGVDLGSEGDAYLDAISEVKEQFPKIV
jgi:hypothetical protein